MRKKSVLPVKCEEEKRENTLDTLYEALNFPEFMKGIDFGKMVSFTLK